MNKQTYTTCLIICATSFACILVYIAYAGIVFGIDIKGRLKRAADSNTISLASSELKAALEEIERRRYTSGYSSVLWRTPKHDIAFWYKNLKSSLEELGTISEEATQLEKSNVLMKLRETILDDTKSGVEVTYPPFISLYPNQRILCFFVVILLGCGIFSFYKAFDQRATVIEMTVIIAIISIISSLFLV